MTILAQSRTFFAALFLAALFGGSGLNLYLERSNLETGLREMAAPRPLSALTALAAEHWAGKYMAWDAYSLVNERLGKSEMNNFGVIKAEGGRLYRGGLYPMNVENALLLAEKVADFAKAAEEKGARVLYVNTPDIVIKGAKKLPTGLPYRDHNVAEDAFLNALREKGVPRLDTRYSPHTRSIPAERMSPKTSLLLSWEGAFAVFSDTVDELEGRFSVSLDPGRFYRDPANSFNTPYNTPIIIRVFRAVFVFPWTTVAEGGFWARRTVRGGRAL